jgi:predicted 3-demethylubiquinone-9 3-methyltransferase (glyoxalase superfamily)
MKGITSCLWFDTQAEEAAQFYTSIFKNSKIGAISRYGDGAPMPKDTALTVSFQLNGQDFLGLNGGPHFQFSPAISFVVNCETQQEVDEYWEKLSAGSGKEGRCGWVTDKFGLSWQIVPTILPQLMQGPNSQRVMQSLMQMGKLDIAALEKAAEQA